MHFRVGWRLHTVYSLTRITFYSIYPQTHTCTHIALDPCHPLELYKCQPPQLQNEKHAGRDLEKQQDSDVTAEMLDWGQVGIYT